MTTANALLKQPAAFLFVLALVGCSFDASKLRALAGRDAAWPADGWASQADIALPPIDGMPEASTVRGDSAALDRPVADLPESIEAGPSDVSYLIPESGLVETPSPSDTAVERTGTVDLAGGGDDGVLTDAPPDAPTDTVGTGGSPDTPIGTDSSSMDDVGVGTIDGNSGVEGGSDGLSRDGWAGGSDGGVGLGSWVKIAGSSPKHFYPGVAYDPVAQRAVLFGGHTACAENAPTNATWEWDGTSWTSVALRGNVPSARGSLAMTFDRANGEAIVHGGWSRIATQPGTYAYNLSTHSWTSRGTSLVSVEWYSLGYDTDAQLVRMFGGSDGYTFFRDVRSWNRTSQTWSSVAPAGPSARARHAWVYDQGHHRFVMFGGYTNWNGGPSLSDTWEYDPAMSSWQQTATTGTRPQGCDMPPPLVYDPQRKVVVMYCYQNGGGTWEYDAGTHVWSKVVGANQVGATSGAVAFYDEERQAVLLVGGCSGGSLQDSTWQYVPSE